MKNRNKILLQILIAAEEYEIEIIRINFTIINAIMDEVEFTFKTVNDKFTIKYLYEKDYMYEVNNVGCYIKYRLSDLLKEGKINEW